MNDTWTKSSLSLANNNCVEMRENSDGTIDLRNSRFPNAEVLSFTPAEWDAFIGGVKLGEFTRKDK